TFVGRGIAAGEATHGVVAGGVRDGGDGVQGGELGLRGGAGEVEVHGLALDGEGEADREATLDLQCVLELVAAVRDLRDDRADDALTVIEERTEALLQALDAEPIHERLDATRAEGGRGELGAEIAAAFLG